MAGALRISIAIVFAALGFMLGACANQYKTMIGVYSYERMQACTFGP